MRGILVLASFAFVNVFGMDINDYSCSRNTAHLLQIDKRKRNEEKSLDSKKIRVECPEKYGIDKPGLNVTSP